jgi:hypothetical protein
MSRTSQKKVWPVRLAATAIAALALGGGLVVADGGGASPTVPRTIGSADALAHRAEQQSAGTIRVVGSADALAHRAEQDEGWDYGSADALAARRDG